MSVFITAIYVKNVPAWERVVRVVLSLGVIVYAVTSLRAPWSWAIAASAAGFAVTGLVGFCPACAMIGRRLKNAPR